MAVVTSSPEAAAEKRKMAISYIQGTDGYVKNEKKGWTLMKAAAEGGDVYACDLYTSYIMDKSYEEVIALLEKTDTYKQVSTNYLNALAIKAVIKRGTAAECYEKAKRCNGNIDGTGYYYMAEICYHVNRDDPDVKGYLKFANLGGCTVWDAEFFEANGMEQGVIEYPAWHHYSRVDAPQEYRQVILAVKKSKDVALARATDILTEKNIKTRIGGGLAKKMLTMQPEAVLEYQKVLCRRNYLGSYTFSFTHQASDSTTRTSGSASLELEHWYATYGATFKCPIENEQLNSWIDSAEKADNIQEGARIRIGSEYEQEVLAGVKKREVGRRGMILEKLTEKYNWRRADTTVSNIKCTTEEKPADYRMVFVPFWFFIWHTDKGDISVRVNAVSGETHVFTKGNVYGQLDEMDDPVDGGHVYDNPLNAKKGSGKNSSGVKFNWVAFILLLILIPGFGGVAYLLYYFVRKLLKK